MITGIDLAAMDAPHQPDYMKAYVAGCRFVILRRSHCYRNGNTWTLVHDPIYARDAAAARAANMVVGAYLFPSFAAGSPSPTQQVRNFVMGGGDVEPGIDFVPSLDVEFPGGITATNRPVHEVVTLLQEFVSELRYAFGVSPMIYTSRGQWHDSNGLNGPSIPGIESCPLWVKTAYRLAAGHAPDTVSPPSPHVSVATSDPHDYYRVPDPWRGSGAWLQQYQGDARGYPGTAQCDLNLFVTDPLNVSLRAAWVQRRLKTLGSPYLGPLNVSGTWDADTTHALREFQATNNLTIDGIVGPRTLAALSWIP